MIAEFEHDLGETISIHGYLQDLETNQWQENITSEGQAEVITCAIDQDSNLYQLKLEDGSHRWYRRADFADD